MERAKIRNSLDMAYFQQGIELDELVETEEALHTCGNTACLAGHIAISPEWLSLPGHWVGDGGVPFSKNHQRPEHAIAEWWGVRSSTVKHFIYGFNVYTIDKNGSVDVYGVPWDDVKAEHVIEQLTLLRDLGEDEYINSKLKETDEH